MYVIALNILMEEYRVCSICGRWNDEIKERGSRVDIGRAVG